MADTKTTTLAAITSPATTDLVYIVADPGGTPASKKCTIANLKIAMVPARVLISEQTPTGTGTCTWDSIPGTYKSLEIEIIARSTRAASNLDTIQLTFNSDTTGANYRRIQIQGETHATPSASGADDKIIGGVPAANSPANSCGTAFVKIINYAGTTFNKQAIGQCVYRYDSTDYHQVLDPFGMEWESTSAITRVDIILSNANFVAGSTLRLYGVN